MKAILMAGILLTMSISETVCVTLPNGDIVCTESNGDNTFIFTTED